MNHIIPKNQRYLPHTLETRYHAVKTYRSGYSVAFVTRRYKISKASFMRWNKKFDGSKDSLKDQSQTFLYPSKCSYHWEMDLDKKLNPKKSYGYDDWNLRQIEIQ